MANNTEKDDLIKELNLRLSLATEELKSEKRKLIRAQEELTQERNKVNEAYDQIALDAKKIVWMNEQLELERRIISEIEEQIQKEKKKRSEIEDLLVVERQRASEIEEQLGLERQRAIEIEEKLGVERQRASEIEEQLCVERQRASEIEALLGVERQRANEIEELLGLERQRASEIEEQLGMETQRASEIEEQLGVERQRASEIEELLGVERQRASEIEEQLGLERQRASDIEEQLDTGRQNLKFAEDQEQSFQLITLLEAEVIRKNARLEEQEEVFDSDDDDSSSDLASMEIADGKTQWDISPEKSTEHIDVQEEWQQGREEKDGTNEKHLRLQANDEPAVGITGTVQLKGNSKESNHLSSTTDVPLSFHTEKLHLLQSLKNKRIELGKNGFVDNDASPIDTEEVSRDRLFLGKETEDTESLISASEKTRDDLKEYVKVLEDEVIRLTALLATVDNHSIQSVDMDCPRSSIGIVADDGEVFRSSETGNIDVMQMQIDSLLKEKADLSMQMESVFNELTDLRLQYEVAEAPTSSDKDTSTSIQEESTENILDSHVKSQTQYLHEASSDIVNAESSSMDVQQSVVDARSRLLNDKCNVEVDSVKEKEENENEQLPKTLRDVEEELRKRSVVNIENKELSAVRPPENEVTAEKIEEYARLVQSLRDEITCKESLLLEETKRRESLQSELNAKSSASDGSMETKSLTALILGFEAQIAKNMASFEAVTQEAALLKEKVKALSEAQKEAAQLISQLTAEKEHLLRSTSVQVVATYLYLDFVFVFESIHRYFLCI